MDSTTHHDFWHSDWHMQMLRINRDGPIRFQRSRRKEKVLCGVVAREEAIDHKLKPNTKQGKVLILTILGENPDRIELTRAKRITDDEKRRTHLG